MLEVNHLTVQYGAIKGVDDLNLTIEKGQLYGLIGPNGAGKTSTLRAISGLAKCAPGSSIHFKGQEIHNVAPHKIVEMGISHVPEGRRIFYTMSVRENILMGNYTHNMNQFKDKLDEVYTLFPRLKERDKQLGGTLSGGEQQMLAIARALVTGGDMILFDEPSMGLAPLIILEIFRIIKSLQQEGKTILQTWRSALRTAPTSWKTAASRSPVPQPRSRPTKRSARLISAPEQEKEVTGKGELHLIAIVADDLSGACDTAVKLCGRTPTGACMSSPRS